eukprot:1779981-Pyramimonas_sp.AAC.1
MSMCMFEADGLGELKLLEEYSCEPSEWAVPTRSNPRCSSCCSQGCGVVADDNDLVRVVLLDTSDTSPEQGPQFGCCWPSPR